jgi:hypothetical protein
MVNFSKLSQQRGIQKINALRFQFLSYRGGTQLEEFEILNLRHAWLVIYPMLASR